MDEIEDEVLLSRFSETGCEQSFTALVERHIHLVYSVAVRGSKHSEAAQEISQAVFTLLARKGPSLRRGTVLAGWLFNAARLMAANHRRSEVRRFKREQEAYMQSLSEQAGEKNVSWDELEPLLDEAMDCLRPTDRDAIVLRYFKNLSLAETSRALGVAERAGQKRVLRAVDKLRLLLMKRGVISSASAIAAVISANSVHAAPVALVPTIAATALKGSVVATPLLILIKESLKVMALTKAKTGTVAVVILLLAVGTTLVVKRSRQPDLMTKIQQANTGLPEAQTKAKMLIFTAMSQNKIPQSSSWCETLNQNGKLWPVTPTNTLFALNSKVAGRAYSKKELMSGAIPAKTIVFFETEKNGWNRSGGAELLPKEATAIAVAFADGTAELIHPTQAATLLGMP
jgi:RNA polymerase sigma factor (sigma-70 family)